MEGRPHLSRRSTASGVSRSTASGTLVARRGILLTSLGIAFGIAGAFLVTRSLAALLFEVSPTDPLTFGALIAVMGAVSFLATAIPARRATRVDPIVALRAD